jgi:hypothetical protein
MSSKSDSPSSSDGDSTGLRNFEKHLRNKPNNNNKRQTRKSPYLGKEYIKQIEKEDAENQSKKEREKKEKIKNLKAKIHSLNSNHSHSISDIEEEIAKLSMNRKPSPVKPTSTVFFKRKPNEKKTAKIQWSNYNNPYGRNIFNFEPSDKGVVHSEISIKKLEGYESPNKRKKAGKRTQKKTRKSRKL